MTDLDVYLKEAHGGRERNRKKWILAGGAVLFALASNGALWVVFASPLFRVDRIEITGNREIAADKILALAAQRVLGDSATNRLFGMYHFLAWPKAISGDNARVVPKVKRIGIERRYGEHAVVLQVEERAPFGIWCLMRREPPQCYWFDEEGIVYDRSIGAEGSLIPVVHDYDQDRIGLASPVVPKEFMANLFSVFEALGRIGAAVREIRLDSLKLQELVVSTYDGPTLFFSLRFPAEYAVSVTDSLREGRIWSTLNYVDFRSENRAYYK